MEKMKIGDRVKISKKYYWAQSGLGTIGNPPKEVKELTNDNDEWEGHIRIRSLISKREKKLFYWIIFDEEHDDGSGDGPYAEAEIDGDFLSKI